MLFVAAVLVAGMAWQLAGVNAALGAGQSGPASGLNTDALNDTADEHNVNDEGISGQAPGSDAGGLIGTTISAGQSIADILGMAVMLPITLENGGVPYYWAYPLGLLGQLVTFIGLAQFVSNRDLR
jgi:hypothetical protein